MTRRFDKLQTPVEIEPIEITVTEETGFLTHEDEVIPESNGSLPRPTVSMACISRLGSYSCTGLVTGRSYHIEHTGTSGIDLEDAEIISTTSITIRCRRTGGWIDVIPAGITSDIEFVEI